MRVWLNTNWFKVGWLFIALIIAGSIGYYYVFYIPKRDQTDRILQGIHQLGLDATKATAQQNLQDCLSGTETNYSNNWDSDCVALGKQANCLLSSYEANRWQTVENQAKDDCFKEYPQ